MSRHDQRTHNSGVIRVAVNMPTNEIYFIPAPRHGPILPAMSDVTIDDNPSFEAALQARYERLSLLTLDLAEEAGEAVRDFSRVDLGRQKGRFDHGVAAMTKAIWAHTVIERLRGGEVPTLAHALYAPSPSKQSEDAPSPGPSNDSPQWDFNGIGVDEIDFDEVAHDCALNENINGDNDRDIDRDIDCRNDCGNDGDANWRAEPSSGAGSSGPSIETDGGLKSDPTPAQHPPRVKKQQAPP